MNKMLITTAGLAEIVNAEKSGTAPVVLSHVAFGSGQYTATADMTALKSEFKRVNSVAGGAIADNLIHLTVHDNSTDAYTVNEIGVFTASGTLFAVYSQSTPIVEKSATSEIMFAIDISLTDIDPNSIAFGDTNFVLNPATTDAAGIVELATEAEATAGTDKTRAMTPAGAKAARDADANIVHRTGNETIAGKKLFASSVYKKSSQIDRETTPTANIWDAAFVVYDKNDKTFFNLQAVQDTIGQNQIRGLVFDKSGTEHQILSLGINSDGDPYATAPTPAAGDNSTKIATTAWVNTKAANFLPLAGGTMTGTIKTGGHLFKNADDKNLLIVGGTQWGNGAGLALYGKNETETPGDFNLTANNGTSLASLLGKATGELKWKDKHIVRSVNGTAADAAGNVAITSVESATKATQDGNGNVIASTYLPLAGGTMSGVIKFSSGYICRADTTGSFQVSGGTGVYGATLQLFGHNHDTLSGQFYIKANDGTNESALRGRPDGKLMWQNKDIVRSVNGKTADDAGNAAITATDVDALPTSGGAMTVDKAIYRNVNTGHLALYGGTGTGNDGAQLDLCGSAHSTMPGTFQLHARNADADMILRGQTNGQLTWNSKYVLTNSYNGPESKVGAIILNSGPDANSGAGLRLYGSQNTSNSGGFVLQARNATLASVLKGEPDGTLMWSSGDWTGTIHPLVDVQKPTADNGYTWYRKYSDGWVEQGGYVYSKTDGEVTVTLPIEMLDTHYNINVAPNYTSGTQTATNSGAARTAGAWVYESQQTTSFAFQKQGGQWYSYWQVSGYAAE